VPQRPTVIGARDFVALIICSSLQKQRPRRIRLQWLDYGIVYMFTGIERDEQLQVE
jgi:hypothetical protein